MMEYLEVKTTVENAAADTAVVVIGRNEGVRLQRCLESLAVYGLPVVYVDSGSSDDSLLHARKLHCHTLQLDTSRPFTAGRARNLGFQFLLRQYPDLRYIQFVDGDCVLQGGWLEAARRALAKDPKLALVCGRRRESYPQQSLYNRLCDMEWNTPVGDASSCGGDFLARVDALRQVQGFDPAVVAGEEPEMCFRLRKRGWAIARIDCEMTLHDAAMTRFGQFWQRAKRSGHAYTQGAFIHRAEPERFQQREVASILVWALAVPLLALLLLAVSPALAALALLVYPLLWLRILNNRLRAKSSIGDAVIYASFILCGKFAQLGGVVEFLRKKIAQRQFEIIEYK